MKAFDLRHWAGALVISAWSAILGSLLLMVVIDQKLRAANRGDLSDLRSASGFVFPMAIAGAAVVGSVLAVRRSGNPAGWLFLGLALSIALAGGAGSYAAYGAVYHPGALPAARLVAVYADGAFVPWVCLLGLILLVTPTGSAPSSRWNVVGWTSAASGLVFLIAIAFRSTPLDTPPFEGMKSPLANDAYSKLADGTAFAALVVAHLALGAAVVSLVVRARRADPEQRQQLRWLLVPAIPFPLLVAGAWIASGSGNADLVAILGGGYLIVVPIAAGLAIEKQRLYDIDRIISRTVSYTLLSTLVVVGYAVVVVTVGIEGGATARSSVPAAVVATFVAIGLGGLSRKAVQDAVDRRFNRRSFAALERVRTYVREPAAGVTVEEMLRAATDDSTLSVAYWNESLAGWVGEDGGVMHPQANAVEVRSATGGPTAAISFDATRLPRSLLGTLAPEARPALDNARLRAAIRLQLVEVRESRRRIISAQLDERKRIERDLHDGSQQRLLALAMNLRATQLSGDRDAAMSALPRAIDEIQTTVRELRELANGLHPRALEDEGLAAALYELAARAPIPIRLNVLKGRLPATVESSAWFIACEAIANVVKHARASAVSLAATETAGTLVLSIDDDGVGGADPRGHGLRGIADRAEAAGGSLTITESPFGGTSIRAVLPCVL
jgi:signal transduction histidine kinase